jgi:hypothetical protein
MNCRVDTDPAIHATFSVTSLDKAARAADNAINWQSDIISIRKHTLNPVINFKSGTTAWAPGFPPSFC